MTDFILENNANYILSKLSDEELLKLLNEFPKRIEYDMDDIIKVSGDSNNEKNELDSGKKGRYLPGASSNYNFLVLQELLFN